VNIYIYITHVPDIHVTLREDLYYITPEKIKFMSIGGIVRCST